MEDGLFKLYNQRVYWFEPNKRIQDYKWVGMLIGLALNNLEVLDLRFPKVFYKLLSQN